MHKIATAVLVAATIAAPVWAQPEQLDVSFDLAPYTQAGSWSFSRGCISPLHPTGRQNYVHVTVVWLEDMNGGYLTTLHRWGRTYAFDLKTWAGGDGGVRSGSGAGIDGVTSATPTSNGTLAVAAQQAQVFTNFSTGPRDISWLPDGTYRVRLETSQCELADGFRTTPSPNPFPAGTPAFGPVATYTFTKGRTAQNGVALTAVGGTAPFSNVRATYTVPATPPPAAYAGPDQWLMPSVTPAQATTMLAGQVSTVSPPMVMWTVVSTKPTGLTPMIASPTSATTSVTFTSSGIYTFRLTATSAGRTNADEVTIYVNARVFTPTDDAEVIPGMANANFGTLNTGNPWLWSAGGGPRGYMRFDLTSIPGSILFAQLQLRPAEMSNDPTDVHEFYLLTNAQDDWNGPSNTSTDWEGTITWNNQPMTGGATPTSGRLARYNHWQCVHRHLFADPALNPGEAATVCPARIDLDLDPTAYSGDKIWTIYVAPVQMTTNGLGLGNRHNAVSNQLLVVEFWQSGTNMPPVANAGTYPTIVDRTSPLGAEPVTLDASASTDDTGIVSYEWREGTTLLGTSSNARFTTPLSLGVHTLQLTVIDGGGLRSMATVTITVEDRFEPNHTRATAAAVTGTGAGNSYPELFAAGVAPAGDWYSIDLVAGSTLTVAATMTGGNLDLTLHDAAGAAVATAATTNLTETAMTTATTAGRYFIQVAAANATSGSRYSMNVTASGSLNVVLSPASGAENMGTLTGAGTVRLDAAATAPVTVMLAASLPMQLNFPNPMVTIPMGQTSATFDVRLVNDPPGVPNTSRFVTITATATGYNPGSAQFEILDDEASLFVGWDKASESVAESSTASIQLRAVLSATSTMPVVVPFTVTGSATRGTDYSTPIMAGQLTISSGTSATYLINLTDDMQMEGDETVILTIGTPTGATASGNTVYTLTINDDDSGATGGGTSGTGGGTTGTGGGSGGGAGGGGATEQPGCPGCSGLGSLGGLAALAALWFVQRRRRLVAPSERASVLVEDEAREHTEGD